MKRLSGFSLMEMMIVLTIVAIVAAASAPMINKKMVNDLSSGSLWSETSNGIAYNLRQDKSIVNIGGTAPSTVNTRLYINNGHSTDTLPHITFDSNNGTPYHLIAGGSSNSIILSNPETLVGIGGNFNIVIGSDARTESSERAIALGFNAIARGNSSIALGASARTNTMKGIAIGQGAIAGLIDTSISSADGAVAIGNGSHAQHQDSVAIGTGARTSAEREIALGTNEHTVIIPGTLDASNMVNNTSDRRLKNVGEKFKSGLSEIKKLEVYNYTFKNDKKRTPRVGVMAQDLKKVFPNAVTKGGDGFLRIRNEDMFYAIVNAIKELDEMFTKHDKRIKELEKQNQELLKRIEALEKAK